MAAALRHRTINKIAAVGALSFHLKRKLPEDAADQALAEARAVLPLMDRELAQASLALATGFLAPARTPPQAVPLAAAVQAVARGLPRSPGVELSGPEPGPLAAAIDAAELAVAVACLLENAIEALAARPAGQIRVSCGAGAPGEVTLEIADDGAGLDERGRAQAREALFTTRPGHVGVGLNVAARIARRWQGRLELEAASPRGLRARLVLPAARAAGG